MGLNMDELKKIGIQAKEAEEVLRTLERGRKDEVLKKAAEYLVRWETTLLEANEKDMEAAREKGMAQGLLDRLALNGTRIESMAEGLLQVAAAEDPVGEVLHMNKRPNGLMIGRKRVPLGVVGIIYEARPNVTADALGLCFKAGNAVILKGGSDALCSNRAIVAVLQKALSDCGVCAGAVQLIESQDRQVTARFMKMNEYVDVLIPRGGAGLIRTVAKEASVPVIRTGEGVCHLYIDSEADLDMGAEILYNAKCSRPSVCNAAECVLIHEDVLDPFLQKAVPLLDRHHVELRCDEKALAVLGDRGVPAEESDWDAEYDDYILAVRTVKDMEEAIAFVNAHGTHHSESIITANYFKAQRFLDAVDAAAVYVNASTRFTDGGEFGLGAEIGISTQKMHARGPMGLEELTSSKYVIYGEGQIRE